MPSTDVKEVFWVALRLGLTSFGGPIAHLGYFERMYVRERQWLTSAEYAGLVALCQSLPGPTSSQVGFLIGLRRAVVGILAAALYDPVWRGGVRAPLDAVIAVLGFALLQRWRTAAVAVAALCVLASVAKQVLSL